MHITCAPCFPCFCKVTFVVGMPFYDLGTNLHLVCLKWTLNPNWFTYLSDTPWWLYWAWTRLNLDFKTLIYSYDELFVLFTSKGKKIGDKGVRRWKMGSSLLLWYYCGCHSTQLVSLWKSIIYFSNFYLPLIALQITCDGHWCV